uniref:Uncharacterized protein n=1 Tax=Timema poppense TaxID=170557 RepID=A0A7R9CKD5_TIMPO|nr:unnamed protein product [Timema poppensis]
MFHFILFVCLLPRAIGDLVASHQEKEKDLQVTSVEKTPVREEISCQHEGRGFNEEESSHNDVEISPGALEDDEPFHGFEVNDDPMLDIGERQAHQGAAGTESNMLAERGPGRPKLMLTGKGGRPTKLYWADQNLALNNDPPYASSARRRPPPIHDISIDVDEDREVDVREHDWRFQFRHHSEEEEDGADTQPEVASARLQTTQTR